MSRKSSNASNRVAPLQDINNHNPPAQPNGVLNAAFSPAQHGFSPAQHGFSPTKHRFSPTKQDIITSKHGSRPGSANSQLRKSAWERAQEQYAQQEKEKTKSRYKTLQVNNEDEILQTTHCLDKEMVAKVFKTKKFTSYKLERLYQRYFFKLNQNNLTVLLAILMVTCVIWIIFHYVGGSTTITKGIILGVILVCFIFGEIFCNRSAFNPFQMTLICYLILVILGVITVLVMVDATPRSASEGVWCTLFFIYMVYTLMPVRMRVSVIGGLSLAVIQIVCAASINHMDQPFLWKQVSIIYSLN